MFNTSLFCSPGKIVLQDLLIAQLLDVLICSIYNYSKVPCMFVHSIHIYTSINLYHCWCCWSATDLLDDGCTFFAKQPAGFLLSLSDWNKVRWLQVFLKCLSLFKRFLQPCTFGINTSG